jgi:chemotaxis protein MotB
MLRVLNERYGVPRDRMAIVGYADTAALDSNDTEQGRGRNRRVDIVIFSAIGLRAEPRPSAPTSATPSAKP